MNQKIEEGKIETSMSNVEKAKQKAQLDAQRQKKKGKKQKKNEEVYEEFNFDIAIIKNFANIGINPPNESSQLDSTIKQINDKKQWYLDNGDAKL